MSQIQKVVCFLTASLLLSALIYRDAMWGESLLAPLDLGPDLFNEYKFMDPSADGIPENHHIIDQFTYDLPLQYAIYRSYHAGQIPWWDPYTYAGRPLLADAHINGTDPIRLLCYAALPFAEAYNWNYILRGIVTGLGMFLLLSSLQVRPFVAGVLALSYQYAGWFTVFFGHPWIQGSFLYFPYLWIVWQRCLTKSFGANVALGGILCGMIFYAGNLQSHTYLPLFTLSFIAAALLKNRQKFPTALGACALSGIIGALLAFPVLSNQVEFYLVSLRSNTIDQNWLSRLMAAPVALCGFYPWTFGSFRTLDATRLIGGGGVAFNLFFGAVASFLAFHSATKIRKEKGEAGMAICQSLLLIAIYLLVIATPAAVVLYSRCAGLAGLGLTILAGLAAEAILDGRSKPSLRVVRSFVGVLLALALVSSALSWFVYPSFKETIARKFSSEEKGSSYGAIPSIAKLRPVQIQNFPREVSLQNPEAAITLVAVLVLGFALTTQRTNRLQRLLLVALTLSAVPVLMFHSRFKPKQPIELWERLLKGGPRQLEAIQQLQGGLRLDESNVLLSDMVFPNSMACLYQVHALYGYSALQPPSLLLSNKNNTFPDSWRADWFAFPKQSAVNLIQASGKGSSRFRLTADDQPATVRITTETHNKLVLDTSSMAANQVFIRTDTWYPGWTAHQDARLARIEPCFTKIEMLPNGISGSLTLEYVPTYSPFFLPAIGSGVFIVIACFFGGFVSRHHLRHRI
ncbi:MAG: hypothetical protein H8M99_11435 [Gloeobacteraceae cyanobacterium ES-bin-144]|nr:hypothetical protein [Verrucomicrobiales bacterium]